MTSYGLLLGALVVCAPAFADFRVQRIQQIPTAPGQSVSQTALDSKGNLIACGVLTTPAIRLALTGFVEKIDGSGKLVFRRTLPGVESIRLALDSQDNIFVAGYTTNPEEFPWTTISSSPGNAFAAKLRAADGTLAYAIELGGWPGGIAVDTNGEAIVAVSAFQGTYPQKPGVFWTQIAGEAGTGLGVVRLPAAGDRILFAAQYAGGRRICYGGSDCSDNPAMTSPAGVFLDPSGNIWVAGSTVTTDLPVTANAIKKTCGCAEYAGDGFLAEFSGDGSQLLYSTYIGTSAPGGYTYNSTGDDSITSAILDGGGHIWMTGRTNGLDLPVSPDAIQKSPAGGYDGFLFEYDPKTNAAIYVSYFGGPGDDSITNLAFGAEGSVVFSGHAALSPVPASGFLRGSDFVATLSPPAMTTLPGGSAGSGLALAAASGMIVSGNGSFVTFLQSSSDSSPNLVGVANIAGMTASGQVAAGELISLYGSRIGPQTPMTADLSAGAPDQLGGVQVLVDGNPVPLLYAQEDQINAILPVLLSADTTQIVVSNSGVNSNAAVLGVVVAAPEAFKNGAAFRAAALNQDQTVNGPDNPAPAGSIVSVFGTGFGRIIGQQLAQSVQVLWGIKPLEIDYAGQAPSEVAGVVQVNFRLPVNSARGPDAMVLQFNVAGWPSSNFDVSVK
jgi:uncharacterized protein (TIGR03437 family)